MPTFQPLIFITALAYLGEAEKETNAATQFKPIVDGLLQFVDARLTDVAAGGWGEDLIRGAARSLKRKRF